MARLPFTAIDNEAAPPVVDRATWQQQLDQLLVREKAHTREGDAISASRRRLPMTEVPADATVVGSDGEVPFLQAFEGRSQLIVYFHMWHDGNAWDQQCEGCTFFSAQVQRPAYLHSRDITLAVLTEGTYEESKPYADFVQNSLPWYSARGSRLTAGRTALRDDRLLSAGGRPGLRDVLEHRPGHRGDGLELPPDGSERVRTPGDLGGLARGVGAGGSASGASSSEPKADPPSSGPSPTIRWRMALGNTATDVGTDPS